MNFKDYKDKKIAEAEVGSFAECLAAMDCLMHHMNDEDEIACWLQDGVPDSGNWRPFGRFSRLEDAPDESVDRQNYYEDLARDMTYDDYEKCVMMFAKAVKRQCFATRYTPMAMT